MIRSFGSRCIRSRRARATVRWPTRSQPGTPSTRRVGKRRRSPNRKTITVLAQIQEVVHVEGRTRPAQVQREIDEYACLLPSPSSLTATLTIHAGPPEVGAALSNELRAGVGPIALEVGTRRYPCVALQPCDPVPAAVHYIGFAVDEALLPSLRSSVPARLRLRSAIEHRDLPLPQSLRAALIDTLSHSERTTPRVVASNAGLTAYLD